MKQSLLAALGFVLGPIVGSIHCLYIRFLNRRGKWQYLFEDNTRARILREAKGVPEGKAGITYGQRIFVRPKFPSTKLVRHELTHVRQYRRYGFFGFLARYGREQALRGYAGNHLEQEARDVAGV